MLHGVTAPSERQENTESLRRCPDLSAGARTWLIERAMGGEDIYAYQATGSRIWNVWLVDRRVPAAEVMPGE